MCGRVWATISTLVIAGAILQVAQVHGSDKDLNTCVSNLQLNRCLNQCVQQYGQILGASYPGAPGALGAPGGYVGGIGGIGKVGGIGGVGSAGPDGPWPTGSSGPSGPYPGDPDYVPSN
ncbi:chorion class CA protein ERA.1 isoform X2 [Diachasma alloeum]|uniref:chorion class CA protein ERA.1 isoform X2 n=1 Tax=Diachasma alloeum TaxID=454923 RepID=UPI000738493F|nr:chorion class CA protein ERA.1 isoform X2 [Diachasma alloeum]